ncbi:hypothetical protein DPEC_G00068730 [Dallia pectoralis]|uniref:Uncharacterized protein n=1 Tax=Dallia pectoralis TaxID=75939 RepID=A0ACC2H2E8_DALPE|nr:hypothetical protein DPEC_G00068730 [Dallia pectoralis]
MEDNSPKFIVTECPPWYLTSDKKCEFHCEGTLGLFDEVVNLMMSKHEKLSEKEKRYKPKNGFKTIRNMVIRDAATIHQKPSHSLLLALMDLVDITGGNDLESMASVDKAGLKHILLAYSNYTAFYIPTKELIGTNGRKLIPVVTQYSEQHNLTYYDSSRSLVGTYTVVIPTSQKVNGNSYFVQEVLFVPGLKSLELLKRVTGNKFEYWDMTLEVPTHLTALTPSFQHIQLVQLLRVQDKTALPQGSNDTPGSHMEEIQPMCCVLDTASAGMAKKKREASVDCIPESQVICNLKHFRYENGASPIVYLRRSGKLMDGKRVNLVPVVELRQGQTQAPELYVSTTVRFCRAVKQSCVKGNGELVSCWNDTLKELERETFITGPDMYQEIHQPALSAFTKRVNPNSWCNYIPKHIESMIENPVMVEVVELAIELMESKIPNAFAVAELLYCPIENVRKYLKMWNLYSSDTFIHKTIKTKRTRMIEVQMRKDWAELVKIASSYGRKRFGDKGLPERSVSCEELFSHLTLDNVAKAQKMWHALVKHDASKIKDKELVRMYADVKVLFLKLRTYQSKVKKGLKVGEGGRGNRPSNSPQSSESRGVASSKTPAEVKERSGDKAMADCGQKNDSIYSIVTPESVPLSTWVKNMSTLLLSVPWLNEDTLRRETVCTLLGLDSTLLARQHATVLRNWVINNRTVVRILQSYGLQDRLSKALVDCLESTAIDNWRHKVSVFYPGGQDRLLAHSDRMVAKPSNMMDHSDQCDRRSKSGSKSTWKQAHSYHSEAVRRARTPPMARRSSYFKSSGPKTIKRDRESRSHSSSLRNRSDDKPTWLKETREAHKEKSEWSKEDSEIPGENLEDTLAYDNSESLDEYDYRDKFIHDGSTEEPCSSSEEEDDEAFCAQMKSRVKGATRQTKNVTQRRKYKRISCVESAEDEAACSGMKDEASSSTKEAVRGYKRALQSDSDDLTTPYVKPRGKRTQGESANKRKK